MTQCCITPVLTTSSCPTGRHHFALLLPVHAAVDGGESPCPLQGGNLESTSAARWGFSTTSPSAHATVLPSPAQDSSLGAPHGKYTQQRGMILVCSDPAPWHALGVLSLCRFYLIAGGIPLIICGITAAVNIHNYHDNNP